MSDYPAECIRESFDGIAVKDHNKKFQTLPDDGQVRYIILASDHNKSPESYGMFWGYYFAGEFQWAAIEEYAFKEFDQRIKDYPQFNWEIYELLPDRGLS